MALFKIKRGLNANLPDVSASTDGHAWFVTDTGDFFIDYLDQTTNTVKRKKISAEYAEKLRYTKDGEMIEFNPGDFATTGYVDTKMLYSNSTPTVNAHGGIAAGSTFDNVPITDMLTRILYPWVAPVVTATSTPNGGTFEKGTTQNVTAISTTITKKSARITNVEVFNGSTSLGAKTGSDLDTINNSGSGTLTFTVSVPVTASNTKFTVKVTDADGKTTSANTGTFTFVYPYYYGVIDIGATVDFANLAKIIQSKGAKSVNYTANNQKMVFATPTANGAIKKITDPNGFDVTGTFTQSAVSVIGLDGTAQDHYLYIANDASTVTSFKMTFAHQ